MKKQILSLILLLWSKSMFAADISLEVKQRIESLFPAGAELKITPFDNTLIEVVLDTQVYFASHDGRYLFVDRVIDIERRQNVTELKAQKIRKDIISQLPDKMRLNFPAVGTTKQTITVFTDIDCPYCRQLHDSIAGLNEKGIAVNYVMLPRAGLNSKSYHKAVSAVCAPDPQQAMTQAMSGKPLKKRVCDNTIAEQLKLASRLGIGSTPVTLLPSGEKKVGLFSVDAMTKLLKLQ